MFALTTSDELLLKIVACILASSIIKRICLTSYRQTRFNRLSLFLFVGKYASCKFHAYANLRFTHFNFFIYHVSPCVKHECFIISHVSKFRLRNLFREETRLPNLRFPCRIVCGNVRFVPGKLFNFFVFRYRRDFPQRSTPSETKF